MAIKSEKRSTTWSTRFPDLEGIETGGSGCLPDPGPQGRPGSLIWKGLRQAFAPFLGETTWSTRFPDLEGIETSPY